jgi:hypothetical protein
MADRDVPVVAQTAADEVAKIVEKYMPADEPPTATSPVYSCSRWSWPRSVFKS